MIKEKKKEEEKIKKKDRDWEIVKALIGEEISMYGLSNAAKKEHRKTEISQPVVLKRVHKLEEKGMVKQVRIVTKRKTEIYTATLYGCFIGFMENKIPANKFYEEIKYHFKNIDSTGYSKNVGMLLDIPLCSETFFQRLNNPMLLSDNLSLSWSATQFVNQIVVRDKKEIKKFIEHISTFIGDSLAEIIIDSFFVTYCEIFEKSKKTKKEDYRKSIIKLINIRQKDILERNILVTLESEEEKEKHKKEFIEQVRKVFNSKQKKDVLKKNCEIFLKMLKNNAEDTKIEYEETYKANKDLIKALKET